MSSRWFAAALVLVLLLASRTSRAEETKPRHSAGPWVVVVAGAAVAAIGVLSFAGAIVAHDDAQSEAAAKGCATSPYVVCPAGVDATTLQKNVDGEHAMNVIGAVMTATGLTAVLGGLAWHFLERGDASRAAFVLTPAVGPRSALLTLSARF